MSHNNKPSCALCQLSEETKITGPLSTQGDVTAHQNCLLFSSGICCENSPEKDDLFGFSVEHVLKEVKRGNQLRCHFCKKKGATAGCERKRCKKSYHYPCALQDEAKTFEDEQNGCYGLYCLKHYAAQINNSYVKGLTKPGPSQSPTEAGPSKVYCLPCEQVEGRISLDNLSHSVTMVHCDKHAPSSRKKTNGISTAASPSVHSNDSSSSSSTIRYTYKRQLSENEKQEKSPAKRRTKNWNGIVTDDSSDSDKNETNTEMGMFAPLDSDLDESGNSVPEDKLRTDNESTTASTSGHQQEKEGSEENKDDDETIIDSDSESASLLLPVQICIESSSLPELSCPLVSPAQLIECPSVQSPVLSPVQHSNGPSVPQQSSPPSPPSPFPSPGSPPPTSSSITPAAPEAACVSSRSPTARPSNPESGIDAANFWKSCNAVGCTQAIFTDFINGMNEISNRILSDEASQEDYDLALSVMAVSGKLTELVAKQQEELQRKLIELQKAAAAMKDVVSTLKK